MPWLDAMDQLQLMVTSNFPQHLTHMHIEILPRSGTYCAETCSTTHCQTQSPRGNPCMGLSSLLLKELLPLF